MQTTFTTDNVTIRDVAPTPVAIMEHRGHPATLGATVQRFIAWRKAAGLPPKASRSAIGMSYPFPSTEDVVKTFSLHIRLARL
jgi:DNA gyrase inhibitor GyrI